jgi:hypothetical protein
MLYEYGVEPSAVGKDWDSARYIFESFGFDQGRLISRFPPKWEAQVYLAFKSGKFSDLQRKKFVEKLYRAKKHAIVDFGREYDAARGNWIRNALAENAKHPFRAIICEKLETPTLGQAVLILDQLDELDADFKKLTSWEVSRTATGISASVGPLLRAAKEIMIVDPYFDLWNGSDDYRGPLGAMLEYMASAGRSDFCVQIHQRHQDKRRPLTDVISAAPRLLRGIIPPGFTLEIYEWKERAGGEDFHDRYVLSDCGGLLVGAGFGAVPHPQNTTHALLSIEDTMVKMSRFKKSTSPFDLAYDVMRISSDGKVSALSIK